jgi:hypothetical protein
VKSESTIIRGAIAGALAATAVAIWFLVIDTVEGRPFYTPSFLSSALLGRENMLATPAALAFYTVVHFVTFIVIGIGMAWLMRRWEVVATSLMGLMLGLLLFDVVFYAGVLITGVNVVRELGWPEVLVGNILAGLVMMEWLERTGEVREVGIGELLRQHRTTRQGLVAGFIGGCTVAIWFLVLDIILERALFTPSALGSAIFYGSRGVAAVQTNLVTVGGYSLLHIAAFTVFGLIISALFEQAEQEPRIVFAIVLLFVVFETMFFGLLAIMAFWLLDALHWTTIAGANLAAAGTMGYYLWREHPVLQRELRAHSMDLEDMDNDVDDPVLVTHGHQNKHP